MWENPQRRKSSMPAMHEVDYKIFGDDMQFVEVELDPGEAAVAEAGGMFYMEDGISMETVFGDGSAEPRSFVDALIGAGKRLLIGESLFMTILIRFARPAASGFSRCRLAVWRAASLPLLRTPAAEDAKRSRPSARSR